MRWLGARATETSLVDHVAQLLARTPASEIFGKARDHLALPSDPVAGHVRGDDHLIHRPKRMLGRQRLGGEHVERGTRDCAAPQGG
jgi:hypothetical protein